MKNVDFIDLLNNIVGSYFVVESNFYKADGTSQAVKQYVAGMNAKRAYTVMQIDKNGNQYVAVDDEDYKDPFCFSWMYRNKQTLDNNDYMFFNVKNPKDLITQIMSFLNKNKKNINYENIFFTKSSTGIFLRQGKNEVYIADVLEDLSTMNTYKYINFNYRNIDVNIIPISEKLFKSKTSEYDAWVNEEIENNLELK